MPEKRFVLTSLEAPLRVAVALLEVAELEELAFVPDLNGRVLDGVVPDEDEHGLVQFFLRYFEEDSLLEVDLVFNFPHPILHKKTHSLVQIKRPRPLLIPTRTEANQLRFGRVSPMESLQRVTIFTFFVVQFHFGVMVVLGFAEAGLADF